MHAMHFVGFFLALWPFESFYQMVHSLIVYRLNGWNEFVQRMLNQLCMLDPACPLRLYMAIGG
jgi:hypothetical protein